MLHELATAVRTRRIHPRELIEESLRRIDDADGPLNAVVARRDDAALEEADRLADALAARGRGDADGSGRPLAGLPLLVKDLTPVAGMRTTYGSTLHAAAPPDEVDGLVVARLRRAGAIVVGKTNTPAFGHTAFTDNALFGPTRNPWNTDRSPGGSSGGSAAALAAGFAPLATATDGGGSVRIPASLCGLVGYKPTTGVIARQPLPSWLSFSTAGGTGTTVADATLEASVLAGPTGGDISGLPDGAVTTAPELPSRVLACPTLRSDVDRAIADALERTATLIERDLALELTWVDAPIGTAATVDWFVIAAAELAQALGWCRDRWDDVEASLSGLLHFGANVALEEYLAAQRRRGEHAAALEELLAPDAVLVTPTCNVTSWDPGGPLPERIGDGPHDPALAVNTPDINLTGHPAVSVPMGVAPDGVPMGLQIVAPRFGDRYALGLATALEQRRPWPANAPGYEPFALR